MDSSSDPGGGLDADRQEAERDYSRYRDAIRSVKKLENPEDQVDRLKEIKHGIY